MESPSAPLLRRIFWLPVAVLVAIEIYASNFDGWGAWATAPLFLVPLVLGLAVGLAGASEAWSEIRSSRLRSSTLLLLAIALAPIAWLLVRRHVV